MIILSKFLLCMILQLFGCVMVTGKKKQHMQQIMVSSTVKVIFR